MEKKARLDGIKRLHSVACSLYHGIEEMNHLEIEEDLSGDNEEMWETIRELSDSLQGFLYDIIEQYEN